MMVQTQQKTAHYSEPLEAIDLPPLRVSTVTPRRRSVSRSKVQSPGEGALIAVILACFIFLGTLGAVYVAAFARVAWQAHQVLALDDQLQSASALHDALVRNVTYLSSDHRISQLAGQMKMAQGGSSYFVDVSPAGSDHRMGQREVASAL